MITVGNLLDIKGSDVLSVEPETTVRSAVEQMQLISAGTALVMEEDKLIGIISERESYTRTPILLQIHQVSDMGITFAEAIDRMVAGHIAWPDPS